MKKIIPIIVIVLCIILGILIYQNTGDRPLQRHFNSLPRNVQLDIEDAYDRCLQCVVSESDSLYVWYQSAKGQTGAAAKELTGIASMWNAATKSEEEYAKYTKNVVEKYTYTEKQCKDRMAQGVANLLYVVEQNEALLAETARCPALQGMSQQIGSELQHRHHGSQASLKGYVVDELITQIGIEIATTVASEVAVSAGVLGTSIAASPYSLGISALVGIGVGVIIDWIRQPEEKIERKLNESIDVMSKANRDAFRAAMLKFMQDRKVEWINKIYEAQN